MPPQSLLADWQHEHQRGTGVLAPSDELSRSLQTLRQHDLVGVRRGAANAATMVPVMSLQVVEKLLVEIENELKVLKTPVTDKKVEIHY